MAKKMLLLSKGKKVQTLVDPEQERNWRSKYVSLEGESLELPPVEEPKRVNKDIKLSRTGIPLEKGWPVVKKKEKPVKAPKKEVKKEEPKEEKVVKEEEPKKPVKKVEKKAVKEEKVVKKVKKTPVKSKKVLPKSKKL